MDSSADVVYAAFLSHSVRLALQDDGFQCGVWVHWWRGVFYEYELCFYFTCVTLSTVGYELCSATRDERFYRTD